jgi:hypothetical protein
MLGAASPASVDVARLAINTEDTDSTSPLSSGSASVVELQTSKSASADFARPAAARAQLQQQQQQQQQTTGATVVSTKMPRPVGAPLGAVSTPAFHYPAPPAPPSSYLASFAVPLQRTASVGSTKVVASLAAATPMDTSTGEDPAASILRTQVHL